MTLITAVLFEVFADVALFPQPATVTASAAAAPIAAIPHLTLGNLRSADCPALLTIRET
jgi:hypothetical protein